MLRTVSGASLAPASRSLASAPQRGCCSEVIVAACPFCTFLRTASSTMGSTKSCRHGARDACLWRFVGWQIQLVRVDVCVEDIQPPGGPPEPTIRNVTLLYRTGPGKRVPEANIRAAGKAGKAGWGLIAGFSARAPRDQKLGLAQRGMRPNRATPAASPSVPACAIVPTALHIVVPQTG